MVSPGIRAGDGARRVAAESIGHEPLAFEEQFSRMARFIPWQGAVGESHCVRESKIR